MCIFWFITLYKQYCTSKTHEGGDYICQQPKFTFLQTHVWQIRVSETCFLKHSANCTQITPYGTYDLQKLYTTKIIFYILKPFTMHPLTVSRCKIGQRPTEDQRIISNREHCINWTTTAQFNEQKVMAGMRRWHRFLPSDPRDSDTIMSSLQCGNNLLYLNSKLFNAEHYSDTSANEWPC